MMKDLFKNRQDQLRMFKDLRARFLPEKDAEPTDRTSRTCPGCGQEIFDDELFDFHYVCPACDYYYPIPPYDRIKLLVDRNSFRELNNKISPINILGFPGYEEKLQQQQELTGLKDAVVTGLGKIGNHKVAIAVMDNRFMMASMGAVVGEKITFLIEYATKKKLPIIIFSASGGARMQEGIVSLMQMAKTSAALGKHHRAGGLYIAVQTHPTTGGVTASFASLGDIILAEPKALIGFTGARVIQQTIKETLPEGFQTAEFLLQHGFIDQIVPRRELQDTLKLLLQFHETK